MNDELHDQYGALGHAATGGHTCGAELSLRTIALATLRSYKGASDVFVAPTHTLIVVPAEGHTLRCENSPELRDAIDQCLMDGDNSALIGRHLFLDLAAVVFSLAVSYF